MAAATAEETRGACGGGVMGVVLQIWREWDTTILVVAGGGLQLALVAAGFVRKRVVRRSFHAAVLVVYVGVEAVSMYSLGLMFASACDHIYAVWAPITLFHMSAADAINAYSPADNELWRRYFFKLLILSLSAASLIVSRARRCHRYFVVSILLMLVSTLKLCERVFCLYCGSRHRILVASRPIYVFMASASNSLEQQQEQQLLPDALLVAGELQWYARHRRLHLQPSSSSSSSHCHLDYYCAASSSSNYSQHPPTPADIEEHRRSFSCLCPVSAYPDHHDLLLVLYSDILHDKELGNRPEIPELCLAFALFKIYRPRLSNLRIRLTPTHGRLIRRFFLDKLGPPHDKISVSKLFRILDLEMSFIFDGVFTKAAAGATFQSVGMLSRIISLGVLVAALVALVAVQALNVGCRSSDGDDAAARAAGVEGPVVEGLTFLLLVVAVAVECLQFYRHVKSDFFRVWLAYTYVRINKWRQQQQQEEAEYNYRRRRKTVLPVLCSNYISVVILALLDYASAAQTNSRFNSQCLAAFFQHLRQRTLSSTAFDVGGNHWHYTVKQRSILADTVAKLRRKYLFQLDVERMRDAHFWQESIRDLCAVGRATDLEDLQAILAAKIWEMLDKRRNKQQDGARVDLREYFAEAIMGPLRTNGKGKGQAEKPEDDASKPLEIVALYYHLATSVCELKIDAGMEEKEEKVRTAKKMSVLLSRYCLHLLLRRPSLIAVDPYLVITRYGKYTQELERALEEIRGDDDGCGENWKRLPCLERVMEAMKTAEDTIAKQENKMKKSRAGFGLKEWIEKMVAKSNPWEELSNAWVGILVLMAVGGGNGAAPPHAEHMARGGGELLTLLWLLLTHIMDG